MKRDAGDAVVDGAHAANASQSPGGAACPLKKASHEEEQVGQIRQAARAALPQAADNVAASMSTRMRKILFGARSMRAALSLSTPENRLAVPQARLRVVDASLASAWTARAARHWAHRVARTFVWSHVEQIIVQRVVNHVHGLGPGRRPLRACHAELSATRLRVRTRMNIDLQF